MKKQLYLFIKEEDGLFCNEYELLSLTQGEVDMFNYLQDRGIFDEDDATLIPINLEKTKNLSE